MANDNVEVMYLEVLDKKPSGFIMNGTENTPYEQQLMAPTVQWVDARGKMAVYDEKKVRHDIEIRFINGCDSIIPKEQDDRGFKPNRLEDKIPFTNGFVTVRREGGSIGLFDYLKNAYWNADNPDRPSSATARYREVKLDKKATAFLDEDELMTQAKSIVYSLRINSGTKGLYKYDTEKIDALCRLLSVWEQSNETKLIVLLEKARTNPKGFLEIVSKSTQTVITEITYAIDLNVIRFDGNTAQYSEGNKVIFSMGNEKMKEDAKIEKLASFLLTEQGNAALTEIRTRLEVAKEKEFKKS